MSGRRVSVGRVRRLHRVLTTGSLIAATAVVGAGLADASSSGAASSDARAAREHVSDQSIAAHRFGPQLMVRKAALSAGAAPQSATYLGAEPGTSTLRLDVVLAPSNASQLGQFISSVSSPASPLYHQYLTEQQFVAQFGPPSWVTQAAASWLQSDGLAVSASSPFVISAVGTAAEAARAFGVQFGRYKTPTGTTGIVASGSPLLPADIASGEVTGVVGLNTLEVPQDFAARAAHRGKRAQLTSAPGAPAITASTTSVPSAPTTDVPTTGSPTTSAPTTSAPTTSAPTTSAPTTSADQSVHDQSVHDQSVHDQCTHDQCAWGAHD
jgi:subtilase family serine protease